MRVPSLVDHILAIPSPGAPSLPSLTPYSPSLCSGALWSPLCCVLEHFRAGIMCCNAKQSLAELPRRGSMGLRELVFPPATRPGCEPLHYPRGSALSHSPCSYSICRALLDAGYSALSCVDVVPAHSITNTHAFRYPSQVDLLHAPPTLCHPN